MSWYLSLLGKQGAIEIKIFNIYININQLSLKAEF